MYPLFLLLLSLFIYLYLFLSLSLFPYLLISLSHYLSISLSLISLSIHFLYSFNYLKIIPSIAYGEITEKSPYWPITEVAQGESNCDTFGESTPFATFTWTQTTLGVFDVVALFANSSYSGYWYSYVALFEGSIFIFG
jgi:hypothetical protein